MKHLPRWSALLPLISSNGILHYEKISEQLTSERYFNLKGGDGVCLAAALREVQEVVRPTRYESYLVEMNY